MEEMYEKYGLIIHNIFEDTKHHIDRFIHPVTEQLFIYAEHYHQRERIAGVLYEKSGHNDAFVFRVQSLPELAREFPRHFNLIDFNRIQSRLSDRDREMYLRYPISQTIGRHADDKYLQLKGKEPGCYRGYRTCRTGAKREPHDCPECCKKSPLPAQCKHKDSYICTFDVNKDYSSILLHRHKDDRWIVPSMWDTWADFDERNETHAGIPYGFYLLKDGDYFGERIQIHHNDRLYSYYMVRKLLYWGYITFDDILQIQIVKVTLPGDYFKKWVETAFKILDAKDAKAMINIGIGCLSNMTIRKTHRQLTHDRDYAEGLCNFLQKHPDKYADATYSERYNSNAFYITCKVVSPNYNTCHPIWRQILEGNKVKMETEIPRVMDGNSLLLAYNTDSLTVLNPKMSAVRQAAEVTMRKDDFDTIGMLKLEEKIKIRGKPFGEKNQTLTEPLPSAKPEAPLPQDSEIQPLQPASRAAGRGQ